MSDQDLKDKPDLQTEGFVDQLRQIQGEYLQLTDLYGRERDYSQKLAELMRALQFEVDATIPLSPTAIASSFSSPTAAFLVSDSVVVAIDQDGSTVSKPLYRLSPETIISVVQDCTPQLKKLISEKRKKTARRVSSLEKVVHELKKAQATFKQSRTDVEQDEQEEEIEEEEEMEPEQAPQPIQREVKTPVPMKRRIQSDEDDIDNFSFSGNFEERRQTQSERVTASQ
ncbi:MAG TPA: hypothetical protein VEJ36_03790 [Nitrososphaerales archaeon]|nr:hypothetical protein [Nitrososphaerales archaeon]